MNEIEKLRYEIREKGEFTDEMLEKAVARYLGERVDDLINSERAEQADRVLRDDLLSSHGKRVLLYCMRLQKN